VAKVIEEGYGERMKGLNLAEKLLTVGRKGKKSGNGFYTYQDNKEKLDIHLTNLLNLPSEPKFELSDEEIADRLILPMLNEAVRCLDENVAGLPGPESASQIDLGSVMGTGFAPFRGGIIFYAEKLGAKLIKQKLESLVSKFGTRFTPAEGLTKRISAGKGFFSV
nr:fatty acid oxidation complex subunit alpha FadJ [Pseudomonadota bacterium]